MAAHAKRSASEAKRRRMCPGSLPFVDSLPDNEKSGGSSFHAKMGTVVHSIIERCLAKDQEPQEYLDRIAKILHEDTDKEGVSILAPGAKTPKNAQDWWILIDQDMIDGATVFTDYVRGEVASKNLTMADVALEQKLIILTERDDSFGTGDAIIDDWPEMLEVADYKNGAGVVVEVIDNDQLRSYILGAARRDSFSHEKYKATIVQPNAPHVDGSIRSVTLTRDELKAFHEELLAIERKVDAAYAALEDEPFDDFVSNWLVAGRHCKDTFCAAQGKPCPKLLATLEQQLDVDFADDPEDGIAVPDNDEILGRLYPWLPVLESFAKAVAKNVLRRLHDEANSEDIRTRLGAKLVEGRSNREWAAEWKDPSDDTATPIPIRDEKHLLELVGERLEIDVSELTGIWSEPKLATGPQMEKKIPKDKKKQFNEEFLHKPQGKISMAPIDDPKPAVEINPGADFDDDPEDDIE